jgi:hypothetical protein
MRALHYEIVSAVCNVNLRLKTYINKLKFPTPYKVG